MNKLDVVLKLSALCYIIKGCSEIMDFTSTSVESKHFGHMKVQYSSHSQTWTGTGIQKQLFLIKKCGIQPPPPPKKKIFKTYNPAY